MTWDEFKKALGDYFTPAELVEMLDISTYDLIEALEDSPYLVYDADAVEDFKDIMGIGDDD